MLENHPMTSMCCYTFLTADSSQCVIFVNVDSICFYVTQHVSFLSHTRHGGLSRLYTLVSTNNPLRPRLAPMAWHTSRTFLLHVALSITDLFPRLELLIAFSVSIHGKQQWCKTFCEILNHLISWALKKHFVELLL